MDVSLKHPFSMLVSGARGVGKTEFINKLLKSKLIAPPPDRIFGAMHSINNICLRSLLK